MQHDFEKYLESEKTFFDREELFLLFKTTEKILEDGKNQDIAATNQMAKKSLDRIFDFVQKFAKVENSLEKIHQIFKCLLPSCYKLLDLPKMNIKLKDDI